MLTLFSTPKAFRGHFGVIQANAIESWARLHPSVEVILFGRDEGTSEICARLGLRHVPDVAVNEHGTPLLSDMFARAREVARHQVVCYSNADIILLPDLLGALHDATVWGRDFLMVGRRCDVDITEPIDFTAPDWQARVIERARATGQHKSDEWIDYFAFGGNAMPDLPEFAVGRPGWDNWVLWNTRARDVPLIDATERVLAVHQNHDYSHHKKGYQGAHHGDEAVKNREIIGTWARMFTIADANWVLTRDGLRRNVRLAYFARRMEIARRRLIDWTRPLRRRFQRRDT